jgi:signal transduction histidine kinase
VRSVRGRITGLAALLCSVILGAAAVLLMLTLAHFLVAGSDDVSRTELAQIAEHAKVDGISGQLADAGEGVVQVVADSGTVVAGSPNVYGRAAITTVRPPGSAPSLFVVPNAPDDRDTETYRVWAQRVQDAHAGQVTIYVGTSMEAVQEATATLRTALAIVVPAALLLLVAAIWYLLGKALRPVEAIRAEVSAITQTSLGRRVPVPSTRDEVAQLAQTMNDMLQRLQAASERERTFVADASHELLSPLAASRAMLETGPAGLAWQHLMRGLLRENAAMEHIVRDLLFLAGDPTDRAPRTRPVDLDDLVLEEAARARSTTEVEINTAKVSAAPTRGDPEELRRLIRNVLENAIRHARHTVTVHARTISPVTTVDVIDDGPGIPTGSQDRVFDRFYRGPRTRTRTSGAGLGLAIARTIAHRHSGTLELVDPGTPGAHFRLTLPQDNTNARSRPDSHPVRSPSSGPPADNSREA